MFFSPPHTKKKQLFLGSKLVGSNVSRACEGSFSVCFSDHVVDKNAGIEVVCMNLMKATICFVD